MSTSRIILSNVFGARFFSYSRLVRAKAFLSNPGYLRDHEFQLSVPRFSCRELCTNASPDYNDILSQGIQTRYNLTKQIMVRGKAATFHQEELINKFVFSHETATPEEWHELVKEVFSLEFGMINDINVDGKVLESCVASSKLVMARSYLSYMKSQKKKFNGAVVSAYIKVCYACRESMTEQDKARMKLFTEFLQNRYAVSDASICESIVKGLLLQHKIDEALDTIFKNEALCKVTRATYSAVAVGLFQSGRIDGAVNFINDSLKKDVVLWDEVYLKWIEVFKNNKENMERLLDLFQLYDIKPTKLICDHLQVVFQSLPDDEKLIASYGTINQRGECSVCHKVLNPLELTEEEFKELRSNVLNEILVAGDVFKNTTPPELQKFLAIVESEAPFDVVLDGLNVAYMVGTKTSSTTHVNLIQHVVAHFRKRGMKVFLIGRQHMRKWPNFLSVMEQHECRFYLINDLSEDDPFMLYATMYSGSHTDFVTRDLLRSEKCHLQSDKYATLFKRWQQAHQIHINYVNPDGRVYLKSPLNFQMNVQRNGNGAWHVPYLNEDDTGDEYGLHRNWLCLNRTLKKKN